MKKIILFSIAMLIGLAISAQEVVSSGGESQSAAGLQLSWTLGEPVIETFSSGSIILTQGLHQSKLTATALTDLLFPGIELKVFPNPTQDFVTIHLNERLENTHYILFDLAGKILDTKKITNSETRLDMIEYPSGIYILKLYSNQKAIQDFRVIKH